MLCQTLVLVGELPISFSLGGFMMAGASGCSLLYSSWAAASMTIMSWDAPLSSGSFTNLLPTTAVDCTL